MTSAIPNCTALINNYNYRNRFIDKFACQTIFAFLNVAMTSPYLMTGLNTYNIQNKCGLNALWYNFSNIVTFLNLNTTHGALRMSESHTSGPCSTWGSTSIFTWTRWRISSRTWSTS